MDPRERFDDPEEVQRMGIAGALAALWTALPGIVTKVNVEPLTVEVQPAVKAFVDQQDGTTVAATLPLLVDVPVVFQRGGGATLTFPIKPGDECLVVFAARSIDTWWQSGGVQLPNEARRHDLSDGFALVGPFSQKTKIAGVSTTAVQLRSDDGAVYYSLNPTTQAVDVVTPGNVTVTAGGSVTVDSGGAAIITAAGGCTINAETTINGNTQINGDLNVSGNINSPTMTTGSLNASTGASIGGISFGTHRHTGVEPGGGTSGGPTA